MDVKTTVLRDGRNRVRGVIGVFADATQKRLIAEMETRLARLEGTEEMALGIAHEIRNPLASIRGAVQELVRTGDTRWTDDDRKLASIVHRESDRLDKIVGEFLGFARTRPPERHPQDVARLVEDAALLVAQRDDAKAFDVRTEVTGGPFIALVDAGQLRQVLLNVAINGLEAMKKHEPAIASAAAAAAASSPSTPSGARPRPARGRLQLLVRPAELPARSALPSGGSLVAARASVEVSVDDDGPGVPPDQRAKVFMPFFTTKKTGLGLGLAIVQKIVRDHGGDVRCEASPTGGARMRIVLPLAEDTSRPGSQGSQRSPATGSGLNRAPHPGSGPNRAPASGSGAARTPSPGYPRPSPEATGPGPGPKA